ncbi:hypothetical protein HYH02_001109 [Chlamydomonas schloesseri]|uniref:Glycosyl transferase CAP10 domain-containing protein n=1 Tax=Chlamydomonas schloesseri TaxID=2026947 RepID=A0A835WVR0_9CHLO|nr:hypothetical protein HYH02_001109 [Chlamydomonas schloesseri]|eukprot:KAG2454068.1 hypothetical protein HYH02_001109 [Chlamydomonas schloesseri]
MLGVPLLALVALLLCAHACAAAAPSKESTSSPRRGDAVAGVAVRRSVRDSGGDEGDGRGDDNVDDHGSTQYPPGGADRGFPSYEEAEGYMKLKCKNYEVTYEQIEHDLAIHRQLGTHYNSTRYAIKWLHRRNGMPIGFFGGRAYLLMKPDWKNLAHHAKLHVAYMRMMVHLEETFGRAIPDVVLVVSSADIPRYVSPRLVNVSSPEPQLPPTRDSGSGSKTLAGFVPGPYPVAGICKSDFWPDMLLIPNFHFHMKLYDSVSLAPIHEFRKKHPWATREPVLFGRFSHYNLMREAGDASTYKLGQKGEDICTNGNATCMGREHFVTRVAKQDSERLDVKFAGMQPMAGHARFKYLINLNGQSISSRLEQLLPLGSLVFTEASGYYAYYYRTLLKHRVNVLEFWRRWPEEVFEELDWAQAHDEEAEAVAAEGARTAATFLTGAGRTCYWFRLLHGLAHTLRFEPRLVKWPGAKLVREVLEQGLQHAPGGQDLAAASSWAP